MAFKFPTLDFPEEFEDFLQDPDASVSSPFILGGAPATNINLLGMGGERYSLRLDRAKAETVKSRYTRKFHKMCAKEILLEEISACTNYLQLENLCRKYGICDYVDLSEINIFGSKLLLKVIVETLYKYPRLRSKMCFVGTHSGYRRSMQGLIAGDREVLKRFGLHHILSDQDARAIASMTMQIIEAMGDEQLYIATAVNAYGFFDALLMDEHDFDKLAFIKVNAHLRADEANGFHPKGCGNTTATVYHEVGHLLDYLLGISNNPQFISKYSSLSPDMIKREVSMYATASPMEFIAEAFAEYMCNPVPRPLAKWVGELIDRCYIGLK